MISYNLRCAKDHEFEGWFRSAADFDEQQAGRKIVCPYCNSRKISKALMAPAVATGRKSEAAKQTEMQKTVRGVLKEMRAHVEKTSDYVGDQFASEARKIHYGDAEERSIYGEASVEEAKELTEEGIEVGVIPWLDDDKEH